MICALKRRLHDLPSVQLAYVAALAARAGHEVMPSQGALVDADVAIVLSSLVDYRRETVWAEKMRARGTRVGFVGLAASKLPQLFAPSADFVITRGTGGRARASLPGRDARRHRGQPGGE